MSSAFCGNSADGSDQQGVLVRIDRTMANPCAHRVRRQRIAADIDMRRTNRARCKTASAIWTHIGQYLIYALRAKRAFKRAD
jgi:hypothetical protein